MMRGSPSPPPGWRQGGSPGGEQIGTLGSRGELTPCPPLQGGSGETLVSTSHNNVTIILQLSAGVKEADTSRMKDALETLLVFLIIF